MFFILSLAPHLRQYIFQYFITRIFCIRFFASYKPPTCRHRRLLWTRLSTTLRVLRPSRATLSTSMEMRTDRLKQPKRRFNCSSSNNSNIETPRVLVRICQLVYLSSDRDRVIDFESEARKEALV